MNSPGGKAALALTSILVTGALGALCSEWRAQRRQHTFETVLASSPVGHQPSTSACTRTTASAIAPEPFNQAHWNTALRLQSALERDDRETIARLVRYPLRVETDRCVQYIENGATLARNFDLVFTPAMRAEIISGHPPFQIGWRGLLLASGGAYVDALDPDEPPRLYSIHPDVWEIPGVECGDRETEPLPPHLLGTWEAAAVFGPMPGAEPVAAWSSERKLSLRIGQRLVTRHEDGDETCTIDHYARATAIDFGMPVTPGGWGLGSQDGETRFLAIRCPGAPNTRVFVLGPERLAMPGRDFAWILLRKAGPQDRLPREVGAGQRCGGFRVECAVGLLCESTGEYGKEYCTKPAPY